MRKPTSEEIKRMWISPKRINSTRLFNIRLRDMSARPLIANDEMLHHISKKAKDTDGTLSATEPDLSPAWTDPDPLYYTCPTCGSGVGQMCYSLQDHLFVVDYHFERVRVATLPVAAYLSRLIKIEGKSGIDMMTIPTIRFRRKNGETTTHIAVPQFLYPQWYDYDVPWRKRPWSGANIHAYFEPSGKTTMTTLCQPRTTIIGVYWPDDSMAMVTCKSCRNLLKEKN